MGRVIVLKGLPASGKSSWAKKQVDSSPGHYKIICNDALRTMMDNGKYSGKNERFMLQARDALILLALEKGKLPIVDGTHLNPTHIAHIRQLVAGKAEVEVIDFSNVDVDECVKRDRVRYPSVGEAVIRKMWRDYLAPKAEPPVFDPSLEKAYVFDVDGTLALMGDRNPYDASTCEEDSVNEPVAQTLRMADDAYCHIILMSGRSDEFRPQTLRWLINHNLPISELHMRPVGDNRKDSIVKRELYEQHIKGKYNVVAWFDDRTQVVSMVRYELGLPCFQVAPGDF